MNTKNARSALEYANQVAQRTFERYLDANASTAAITVPEGVSQAAADAYRYAGGIGNVRVIGRGNRTHPVISVSVELVK